MQEKVNSQLNTYQNSIESQMAHTLQQNSKAGHTSFDRRRMTADGFNVVLPELGKRGYGISGAEQKAEQGNFSSTKRANSKLQTVEDFNELQAKMQTRRNQYSGNVSNGGPLSPAANAARQ